MKRINISEYIGKKVGRLTLIGKSDEKYSNGAFKWECLCDCGNNHMVQLGHFVRGTLFSCGCIKFNFKDIQGKSFGRWKVLGHHKISKSAGTSKSSWLCRCSCGEERRVLSNSLLTGSSLSCGCLLDDTRFIKHGMTGSSTYKSWDTMKQRCDNVGTDSYKNYGGRGIAYDPKWETFEGFLEDMGERPEGMTLDRIDNDGNYEKGNCRWACRGVQVYNSRRRYDNISGRTGVQNVGTEGKPRWRAEITYKKVVKRLGTFESFDEAVKARESAELRYYGFNRE